MKKRVVLESLQYKELQEQVLKRDNYKCVICNSRSGLQIHHIIKRSKRRLDQLNNLITLCYIHHRKIELNTIKILPLIIDDILKEIVVTGNGPIKANIVRRYIIFHEPKEK